MTSAKEAERMCREIARSCRREPVGVRAILPFDPRDPQDILCWLNFTESCTERPASFQGTDAWIRQSWRWKVKDVLKTARRQMPRDESKLVKPISSIEAMAEGDHPASRRLYRRPLEMHQYAEATAIAAKRFVGMGSGKETSRRKNAAFTCLGRVFGLVQNEFGSGAAHHFFSLLLREPAIAELAASDQDRDNFVKAVGHFAGTGNLRKDLTRAGLHWPGTAQWAEFRKLLKPLWPGFQSDPSGTIDSLEDAA